MRPISGHKKDDLSPCMREITLWVIKNGDKRRFTLSKWCNGNIKNDANGPTKHCPLGS